MSLTIAADRLVGPDAVTTDARVTVEGDRIVAVATGPGPADVHTPWLLPGAVDLHCHGGGGADLESPDRADVACALAFHRRHGTTTSLISVVSAPIEALDRRLRRIAAWVDDGLAAGIHLEGPFLSAVRCGAIDPDTMIDASPELAAALLEAAGGHLRVVTVAPERPGVMEVIPLFADAGVVVAVGHTDATAEQVHAAIAAGATSTTHLGNGMAPFHHRSPGPFGACLVDPGVTCELIADGHHLHPDTVRLAVAAKGPHRVTLCTDAVAAAGAAPGAYDLGGQSVTVADGVVRLDRSGALAGSTLTMAGAVANAARWGVDPLVIARAASTNPAALIGLDDRGVIAPGRRADLMLFDEAWALDAVVAEGVLVQDSMARSTAARPSPDP
ncbi:MAG: N-acetylglucosamine-6-phosphate deacetylase [Actinobacteria bacterium]|nr:N-acetylglucosamine-6-phosphate deacetylase [Actinomycetota bacterium]